MSPDYRFLVLTTWPKGGTGNVGDKLITESAKDFLQHELGEIEFEQIFRGKDLTDRLDYVNSFDTVLLPGFAVREPISSTYAIAEVFDKVSVPAVPLGSGWKSYPGDRLDAEMTEYNSDTKDFLSKVSSGVSLLSTRDYMTDRAFRENGVANTVMTGDCAWYDTDYLGEPMHRPKSIDSVVLTTPHSGHYESQAIDVADMLFEVFPSADVTCTLHSKPTSHEQRIADHCQRRGGKVVNAANNISAIDFYKESDLHVGYRVHGHVAHLRKRRPSILISEDGRGVGFSNSLGHTCFQAFSRRVAHGAFSSNSAFYRVSSLFDKHLETHNKNLVSNLRHYIDEEYRSDFRRISTIAPIIDETYEKIQDVIRNEIPAKRTI
ncbi:polysaccharide pyruvyl transferase family protein [Natronosalvus halobius]|uniref:polysaccharide pyruvyl transferase family protein n=1 Tax=Natronosalvus halobius TaxID=2953746 RepID=UPI00209F215E|nr:polysaccharide pyruvyl transferase family protein [Natronosalvus halobius]USZ71465.1 polysaccharide pyruvyl transferase family protein [Natronosalvus halobius]